MIYLYYTLPRYWDVFICIKHAYSIKRRQRTKERELKIEFLARKITFDGSFTINLTGPLHKLLVGKKKPSQQIAILKIKSFEAEKSKRKKGSSVFFLKTIEIE